SQAFTHDDRLLSLHCHLPGILREKERLRSDHSPDSRNPHDSAVKMSGKDHISAPFLVSLRISRIVGKQDLQFSLRAPRALSFRPESEPFRHIRPLHTLFPELFICGEGKLQPAHIQLHAVYHDLPALIFQKNDAALLQPLPVIPIRIIIPVRHLLHPLLMVSVGIKNRADLRQFSHKIIRRLACNASLPHQHIASDEDQIRRLLPDGAQKDVIVLPVYFIVKIAEEDDPDLPLEPSQLPQAQAVAGHPEAVSLAVYLCRNSRQYNNGSDNQNPYRSHKSSSSRLYSYTMAITELLPIRSAPACTIASASFRDRTPPDALTPISAPASARISLASSVLAPPEENPVEVLPYAAPASLPPRHAPRFSSSVSRQV